MKRMVIVLCLGALGGARALSGETGPADVAPPGGELCRRLAELGEGQSIPAQLSGAYINGLFCPQDVEPFVSVDFGDLRSDPRIAALAGRLRPTLMTLAGTLGGPPAVLPDDLAGTPLLAFTRRWAGRHQRPARVSFKVERILAIDATPSEQPGPQRWPKEARPLVKAMDLPRYQWQARYAGIEGDVVVEARLHGGRVVERKLIAGDRLLALAAFENLDSWQVEPEAEQEIEVTYAFRLELRESGAPQDPRILLDLPARIEVRAPRNGWD